MRKMRKSTVAGIVGVAVAVVGLFVAQPTSVSAASLHDAIQPVSGVSEESPYMLPSSLPNKPLNIISPGSKVYMDSQYTFIPKVTNSTQVKTWGPGWSSRVWWHEEGSDKNRGQPANTPYFTNMASDHPERKGKIGVTYTNVGSVNGQSLDLKITLRGWDDWFYTNIQGVSFRKDEIAFSMSGYDNVDMKWEFVKSGTQTPVKVSGYFTFGDIDLYQGIEFSKNSTNAIDAIMIERAAYNTGSKKSSLQYSTSGGKLYIYDNTGKDSHDDTNDPATTFSMLYHDQSSIDIRWKINTAENDLRYFQNRWGSEQYKRPGYASGDYMFYNLDKPVATLAKKPNKTGSVDLTTGMGNYKITHTVPQESSKFYYKNYRLIDEVKPGLMNPKVVNIKDQKGHDVTSQFTIANLSTKAIAQAKPATLSNPSFYGNTYTVTLTAEVDYDYINKNNASSVSLQNLGFNETDHRTIKTDAVTPVLTKQTVNVKHINEDNGDVLSQDSKKFLPGSLYTESAIFNGSGYGTDGKLQLVRVEVNGKNEGAKTKVSGRVPNSPLNITFLYRSPFKVSVNHVDDDSDKTIHVDVNKDTKFKGDAWKYNAGLPVGKDSFSEGGVKYPYYPVVPSKSGKIDFQKPKDYRYNVEFRYTKPAVAVGLKSVRIKTDDPKKGLPIDMDFDMNSVDQSNWGGEDRWATTRVGIQIRDKSNANKVIYNETHAAKTLRDKGLSWTIPSTGLSINQIRDYEIVLTAPDKTKLFIHEGKNNIVTKGYTASEEVVKVSSSGKVSDRELSKEWVAMTEKFVGSTPMKKHMEGLGSTVGESVKMPSGYGHGHIDPIKTWTELDASEIPKVKGLVVADTEISEGNYETSASGDHVFDMSDTVDTNKSAKTATTAFAFPQTYVTEDGDGDVVVGDRLPSGAMNGGEKLYITVWPKDLGEYKYTFKSSEPIGRNRVKLEVEHVVDVASYMFAHSDSDTLDKDALLVEPVTGNWFTSFTDSDPFKALKDYAWVDTDFTYDGATITGFSADGLKQYANIPEGTARLEIPAKNPKTGEMITAIAGTSKTQEGSFYKYTFTGDFKAPNVKTIGKFAFYNSQFNGQFSGSALTNVDDYAFMHSQFTGTLDAPNLKTVGRSGFYHSNFNGTLNVPNKGVDAFYHSNSK